MKLVWNSSGDELPIEGNQQLVDYYVNGLNLENKNKFTVKNTDISIESINLFDTPKFLPNSYVWVSNAFLYEPTLFEFGYQYCQNKFKDLLLANKDCKISSN